MAEGSFKAIKPVLFFSTLLLLSCSTLKNDKRPLWDKLFGSGTHDKKIFLRVVDKLNSYSAYAFQSAYETDTLIAYNSQKAGGNCWFKFYFYDTDATRQTEELSYFRTTVFRYGNWVGYCPAGDVEDFANKVRYILVGEGEME